MSLVHYSVTLNKLLGVMSQIKNITQKEELEIESGKQTATQIIKHLFDNVEVLDVQTTIVALRALNNKHLGVRDSITSSQLHAMEDKIVNNFPEFINGDISQSLAPLMMLDHKPVRIIAQLNEMNKLSIFKIDQCLRILRTMMLFPGQDNTTTSQFKT